MENEKTRQQEYERILIDSVRTLPQNRAEQLVDFARFLEAQILAEELIHSENLEELEIDNKRWDAIFETEASEELLEKLAKEALAEYRTGKPKPMTFNEDGQSAGMRSIPTSRFWKCYADLPKEIQRKAGIAYKLWQLNPHAHGLYFKRVSNKLPVYSVGSSLDYRALGLLKGDTIVWFWIGNHEEYLRLLKQL